MDVGNQISRGDIGPAPVNLPVSADDVGEFPRGRQSPSRSQSTLFASAHSSSSL
jgi:hypothetical protein